MSYSTRTRFFSIPYMGTGDYMTQENNAEQMDRIDSLLYVATGGTTNCFLAEGTYAVSQDPQDTSKYILTVSPATSTAFSSGFSLFGILSSRPFYSFDTLTCDGLEDNTAYDIYVEPSGDIDDLFGNPGAFKLVAIDQNTEITDSSPRMLAYSVRIMDGTITELEADKTYGGSILSHISDNHNPHGTTLYQDSMVIEKSLSVSGNPVYGTIIDSFTTTGGDGDPFEYQFPEGKKIVFAEPFPESVEAGTIAWRIQDNKVLFTNSGNAGITVNVKFDVTSAD